MMGNRLSHFYADYSGDLGLGFNGRGHLGDFVGDVLRGLGGDIFVLFGFVFAVAMLPKKTPGVSEASSATRSA